ncbi:hypothetical protein ACFW1A_20965, partial [Kitasatospora sp. NPDC058965]|uniref:hypothetical protein n=1 Tax=Kitasatospora sp. NPDC058965 TaxID=3346682 RepID=UPI0036B75C16
MSQDAAAGTRQLIADWLAESPGALPGEPGLRVPPAGAAEVIAAARRIALGAGGPGGARPAPHP